VSSWAGTRVGSGATRLLTKHVTRLLTKQASARSCLFLLKENRKVLILTLWRLCTLTPKWIFLFYTYAESFVLVNSRAVYTWWNFKVCFLGIMLQWILHSIVACSLLMEDPFLVLLFLSWDKPNCDNLSEFPLFRTRYSPKEIVYCIRVLPTFMQTCHLPESNSICIRPFFLLKNRISYVI
jgi:hypothetical protein